MSRIQRIPYRSEKGVMWWLPIVFKVGWEVLTDGRASAPG